MQKKNHGSDNKLNFPIKRHKENVMSDTVLITLIIAIAVVIILFIFRDKLSAFNLTANKRGLKGNLKNYPPPSGVTVSGNVQQGDNHEINVGRDDATVIDNIQDGRENTISVQSPKK